MNFSPKQRQDIGFQLAPMVDVIFLLLCFFVSSQIFAQWETELDVTIPSSVTGADPMRMSLEIILNVKEDGTIVYRRRELSTEELEDLLMTVSQSAGKRGVPVIIRGDMETSYKHVIQVMDLCRKADIYNISFATARAKGE